MKNRIVTFALVAGVVAWCGETARGVELEIVVLDGTALHGRLVQVMPEVVIAGEAGETALAWTEILQVRPTGSGGVASSAEKRGRLRFLLADGSDFGGDISEAEERALTIEVHGGQSCRIDYSWLGALHVRAAGAAAAAKLAEIEAAPELDEDVAVIERGTKVMVLRGAVKRIDAGQTLFRWKDRDLPLPWERLAGLAFARPAARGASHSVRLHDGDAFNGRVIGGDETAVVLQSSIFERLTLDWASIERIDCRGGRLTYLSDLKPADYEFTPFVLKHWNYACDRTLSGREIRLGGEVHRKGVSMHSRSSLAYEINGEYRQFAATVGIADEAGERGAASLAVLGDGRILWRAEKVRGGEAPLEVLTDVTGVRELSLHVDFGEELDLADHVCWGSARLVK